MLELTLQNTRLNSRSGAGAIEGVRLFRFTDTLQIGIREDSDRWVLDFEKSLPDWAGDPPYTIIGEVQDFLLFIPCVELAEFDEGIEWRAIAPSGWYCPVQLIRRS